MAGRRPIPTALKILRGNPGKQPLRDDEPQAILGAPKKPSSLGQHASGEWDRLVVLLEGEQRLSVADAPHILAAAIAYQGAMDYRKKAAKRGLDPAEWRRYKTGERMQWGEYRKCVNDLCLSQGTRARAKVGGRGKEAGKLQGFFDRQRKA